MFDKMTKTAFRCLGKGSVRGKNICRETQLSMLKLFQNCGKKN